MIGPVTLADLSRANKLLWVFCRDCCHERDVAQATASLPGDTPVPYVGVRFAAKIDARPELYPGGIVAMREPRR